MYIYNILPIIIGRSGLRLNGVDDIKGVAIIVVFAIHVHMKTETCERFKAHGQTSKW